MAVPRWDLKLSGNKALLALLSLVLLVGVVLRLHRLGSENIWVDEGYSLQCARRSLTDLVGEVARADKHPPLYYSLLHGWIRVFGESELSIRMPSALFGILCLLVIYQIGRLLFGEGVGLLGCLILAGSTLHIRHSQDARMYTLMSLLSLLSFYFYLRLLRERKGQVTIGYIISTSLLMYTHYYAFFLLGAQYIHLAAVLVCSRERPALTLRKWIALQAVLLLLFGPWIPSLAGQIGQQQAGFWLARPDRGALLATFKSYAGCSRAELSVCNWPLVLIFLALTPLAPLHCRRVAGKMECKDLFGSLQRLEWSVRLRDASAICLLGAWLLTPVLVPFVFSQFRTPIYLSRYTISCSLALYLLVARGLETTNRYFAAAVAGAILVLSLCGAAKYYARPTKPEVKKAVQDIEKRAHAGDLVLFKAGWREDVAFVANYYSKRTDLLREPFPQLPADASDDELRRAFEAAAAGTQRVWGLLHWPGRYPGLCGSLERVLEGSYTLSFHRKYHVVEVFLFEKTAP